MLRDRKDNAADPAQIALLALSFVLSHDTYRDRFMALSGAAPQSMAGMVHDNGFLAGVLDYLLQDETMLLAFCANHDLTPQAVTHAGHVLSPVDFDG